MPHDIAFLHTSPAHVPTFSRLLQELAPALRGAHRVREDLLADALQEGVDCPGLIGRVHEALAEAASSGAAVVVCTCSTIGGIAESRDGHAGYRVTRIDRAMADVAARSGPRVLLVAALNSTLAPTSALLQSSAARLGAGLDVVHLVVAGAWAHFQSGDHARYIDAVVAAVTEAAPTGTVVLAQASMAPAAERLAARGITGLTSPRLGTEHAVALHQHITKS
jgi:hypothetical protein